MKKGFTLIELLVVVLIMGILASVALPQYLKSVERARTAEAINWMNAWADAEERHYMKTGSYVRMVSDGGDTDLDIGIKLDESKSSMSSSWKVLYPDPDYIYLGPRNRIRQHQYTVTQLFLQIPTPPGSGKRTWGCKPMSNGCQEFLPHGDGIVFKDKI